MDQNLVMIVLINSRKLYGWVFWEIGLKITGECSNVMMHRYKRIQLIYRKIFEMRTYDGCDGVIYLGYSMRVEDVSFGIHNEGLLKIEGEDLI
jgi:hypothetical protein